MIVWRHALLSLSLAAAGCHLVLGFGPPARETGVHDRSGDGPASTPDDRVRLEGGTITLEGRAADRTLERRLPWDSGPVKKDLVVGSDLPAGPGPLWSKDWPAPAGNTGTVIAPAGTTLIVVGVAASGAIPTSCYGLKVLLDGTAMKVHCGTVSGKVIACPYTLFAGAGLQGTHTFTVASPATKIYVVASAWSSKAGAGPPTCNANLLISSISTPSLTRQLDQLALAPGSGPLTWGAQTVLGGDPAWITYWSHAPAGTPLSWSWKGVVDSGYWVLPINP